MASYAMLGTLSAEDIYGVGTIDTLSDRTTQAATNPTTGGGGENTIKDGGIFNINGKFFGQPISAWLGIFAVLIVLKIVVENPAIKKTLGG